MRITVLISPTNYQQQADFWQGVFFHLVLYEYANQSHDFPNLNVCDVTLVLSIMEGD